MNSVVDYDGAWTLVLEKYLPPFLKLCFSQVAAGIDWSQPAEFLDQELREAVRDAELGSQRADKLVRVQRRGGGQEWVLIHVEVQAQRDPDPARRMYQYYHRTGDRFGRPVASLALLADAHPAWRPGPYEQALWGCRLRFEYPSCKLTDLAGDEGKWEASGNPVAIVIAAHLAAQRTGQDMGQRYRIKWSLTRQLYERGFKKKDILELFRLIDWLVALPEDMAVEFRRELRQYEQEKRMAYVTSIERLGRQEGLAEGHQKGLARGRQSALRESVLELLEVRFGKIPPAARKKVESISDEVALKRLHREAALASSLKSFLAQLERS
jgi:hypothetical protein